MHLCPRYVPLFAVLCRSPPCCAVVCRHRADKCRLVPRRKSWLQKHEASAGVATASLAPVPSAPARIKTPAEKPGVAEVINRGASCAVFRPCVPLSAALCSTLPSSCRLMPSCAAPKKLPAKTRGVCWRCDCVTCLGSLGASQNQKARRKMTAGHK